MAQFVESGWTLDFDDGEWPKILKWDDDPTFVHALQRLQGSSRRSVTGCLMPRCRWAGGRSNELVTESTRAVDFACIGPGGKPWLVEVKAVRGTGPAETIDERAFDIAAKIRDSLCGLEWARVSGGWVPGPELADIRASLGAANTVGVLVIFEDLRPGAPLQTVALSAKLRELTTWLRGQVLVAAPGHSLPPGLSVT